MKRLKIAFLLFTVFAGLIAAGSADARWRHRARVGVFIGAPLVAYSYYAWPRYYYPPAYPAYPVYPAPVVVPSPPQYIEQAPPAPVQGSSSYWYYCRESQAYYPYVQTCPSPWQAVAPNS